MSYAVATWADTSTSQAIKDSGQRQCVYSNLGKITEVAVKSPETLVTPPFVQCSAKVRLAVT